MKKVAICVVASIFSAASFAQEALGVWSSPVEWPIFAIHVSVLPDKDPTTGEQNWSLLIWNRSRPDDGPPYDPEHEQWIMGGYPNYDDDEEWQQKQYAEHDPELFCSGHTFLEDGTLYVGGGHMHADAMGIKDVTLYRWAESQPWLKANDMVKARWYPTCVMLPNRRVMTHMGTATPDGGENGGAEKVKIPELWVKRPSGQSPAGYIKQIATAERYSEQTYPHMWVDPRDGNIIYTATAGDAAASCKYDLLSSTWSNTLTVPGGVTNVKRNYASSVMVNGIIMRSGGSVDASDTDAVSTSLYIDLNDSSPEWVQGPSMNYGRKNHTLVALPTGNVLAMGGNSKGESDSTGFDRTAPEMWNPYSPSTAWKLYDEPPTGEKIRRGYHSTATLLPDARVLVTGGESENATQRKVQIFKPPYGGTNSWESLRPVVTSSPDIIRYGESFSLNVTHNVGTPRVAPKISLISLPSTTHAFNQNQRFVWLTFTDNGSGSYTVNAPSATKIAPPGYYMLFVNDERVPTSPGYMRIPSEAKIVKLVDYSMILADTGGLTLDPGTYGATETKEQTYIGDQDYLGTYIALQTTLGDKRAELVVEGTAHQKTSLNSRVRVQVECSASVSGGSLTVYLWNWDANGGAGEWQQVGSAQSVAVASGAGDTNYVFTSSDAGGSSPYIKTGDLTVMAKLKFTCSAGQPPGIYLDVVELGIKQ
ncbi:MAG: galactose oxidase early set domain-containing protein [Fimbriimonadaceae bacterium]